MKHLLVRKEAAKSLCAPIWDKEGKSMRALDRLGMKFTDESKEQTHVELPAGWYSKSSSHGIDLLDSRGVKRGEYICLVGDCMLDDSAHLHIFPRFQVKVAFLHIDECLAKKLRALDPQRYWKPMIVGCSIIDNLLSREKLLSKRWLTGTWEHSLERQIWNYGEVFLYHAYPDWKEIDAYWDW